MCNCNKRRTYEAVTSINLPPANPTESAATSASNAAGNANSN